jgi:FdhD protein
MRVDDPFAAAILVELATAPPPGGMSLPRLAKRLGLGVSAVLRQLSLMGDAVIGGQTGPGWVRVEQTEERWVVYLTEVGHGAAVEVAAQMRGGEASGDEKEPS